MPPNDLVPRVATIPASEALASDPAGGRAGSGSTAPATAAAAGGGEPHAAHPNPVAVLDAASGLVVLEFRSETGQVTHTVPSRQQIGAYEASLRDQPSVPFAEPDVLPRPAPTHGSAAPTLEQATLRAGNPTDPVSDAAAATAEARAAATVAALPPGSAVRTSSTTGT
jgi:hypothetical protein